MSASPLPKWFPWALSPVICNAPMLNVACPAMATEVTKAGGIGFLGSVFNVEQGSQQLNKLDEELKEAKALLGTHSSSSGPVQIGVSFITGHSSIGSFAETALPIIAKHRPAAVWLFAPDEAAKPHAAIIRALKGLDGPAPRVFVQVGNVAAAREALADGADVLVCQGIDAGGHQFRRGMGVVTFVPEVRKMLKEEFQDRDVGLLAAGGIVNEKGVAAVMALEADGVVMGTRFTVADESIYPEHRKQLVLETVDGGSSTLKSPFMDELNKHLGLWGPLYDGRAIIRPIHDKFMAGATVEECKQSLKDDYTPEETTKMLNTWAGTGVGLVRERLSAGEIVKGVREGAKEHIRRLAGLV